MRLRVGTRRVLLVAAFLLPGCANPRDFFNPAPPEANSSAGPQEGQPAPESDSKVVSGTPFRLSDYKGKVVALVFWGEW